MQQYSSVCVLQSCSEQRPLHDFKARSHKSASKDLISCPVSPSLKICIISCHIHIFVSACNLKFQKNSRIAPIEFPKNSQIRTPQPYIPKEFPNQRIPRKFLKNFQRIPKKFQKNPKKIWLALIGRNPFRACFFKIAFPNVQCTLLLDGFLCGTVCYHLSYWWSLSIWKSEMHYLGRISSSFTQQPQCQLGFSVSSLVDIGGLHLV